MRYKNLLCTLMSLIFIMYVIPCGAYAEESRKVRVAMLEYPNYISTDENGAPYGYACEYLDEIAKYTGWTYEYVPVTFSEAVKMLENGTIDIVPGSQYIPERAEKYDFSAVSMGSGGTVLCVPADCDRYAFEDYESYTGMRIAALAGSARIEQTEKLFKEKGIFVQITTYPTDADAKEAVARGEADAILMSSIRCEEQYKIIANVSYMPLYFTSNPHDPSILDGINYAQQQIHFDRPYYESELNQKYYGSIMSSIVFTSAEKQYIEENPVISVAYSDGCFPFSMTSEGEPEGISIDILNALSDICGISFRYEAVSDSEKTSDSLKRTGCSIYAGVTDKRLSVASPELKVSDVYYNSYETLFSFNGGIITSDCTGVAALSRTYSGSESSLSEMFPNVTFNYYNSSEEALAAAASGKADFVAENILMAEYLRQKPAFADMTEAAGIRLRQSFVYGFAQDTDSRLISIINKSLLCLNSDDISHIVSSFVSDHRYEFTLRDNIEQNMVLICIIAVIVIAAAVILFIHNSYREKNRRRLADINAKLEQAVKDAELATKQKNNFIIRMTSAALEPLNDITELSAQAEELAAGSPELTDNIRNIRKRAEKLLDHITAFRCYTDAKEGRLEFSRDPAEIIPFLREISSAVFDTVREKSIGFSVNSRGFTCKSVYWDSKYTKYIYTTLIKCAARFTPKGGRISLEFEQTADYGSKIQITAAVSDSGKGITEEDKKYLLEPMEHPRPGAELDHDITSLELATIKAIVDRAGGTLSVESGKSGGTRIVIVADYDKCADIVSDYADDINIAPKVNR